MNIEIGKAYVVYARECRARLIDARSDTVLYTKGFTDELYFMPLGEFSANARPVVDASPPPR